MVMGANGNGAKTIGKLMGGGSKLSIFMECMLLLTADDDMWRNFSAGDEDSLLTLSFSAQA